MLHAFFPLAFALATAAVSASPQDGSAVWTQAELEQVAREVQADIERIRGDRFRAPVQVKAASQATLKAYIEERSALMETPERRAADEAIAKLLGMAPPEADLHALGMQMLADQVAGFYDPPSKTFYLMDSMPKAAGGPIMSHELVHALADQLFDIDARLKELEGDSDRLFAYRALVEGSGMAGLNKWVLDNRTKIDLSQLTELQERQNKSMADAPEWLWKPMVAAYLQGTAFLSRTDNMLAAQLKAPPTADIHAAFRDIPVSSEQVLHPEKYWDATRRDLPRAVTLALADLPAGWVVQREDTLGEMALAMITDPLGERMDLSNPAAVLGVRFTHPVSEGWGGDRLALLEREGAAYLVVATAWDTPRDAAEFYGAVRALLPRFEAAAKGLAAARKLSGTRASGAGVRYGESESVVLVEIHCGVEKKDLRGLQKAVGVH